MHNGFLLANNYTHRYPIKFLSWKCYFWTSHVLQNLLSIIKLGFASLYVCHTQFIHHSSGWRDGRSFSTLLPPSTARRGHYSWCLRFWHYRSHTWLNQLWDILAVIYHSLALNSSLNILLGRYLEVSINGSPTSFSWSY